MQGHLTIAQAAEEAQCGKRYILDELERGKFPNAQRLDPEVNNSPWLIPRADFDAWMTKRTQARAA